MNFRKVNNITGWAVGLIACAVYILSREAGGSFWDCGEFVSCAYKVQMPHPPGAPLFVLLGRFFIILFGNNQTHAASAVNLMSAVASGLAILFLFWTITHFARKMFVAVGEEMTGQQIFTVMSAGVVGALAYCFSDSFWYSAVEGEVYALSAFFTALCFWAMLKWEHADEKAGNDQAARNRADRWIVFIFFMTGLSIGVHLLNLLIIPAIVMIYYFRRYQYKLWGAIFAFVIGCMLTGLVQVVIVKYSMKAASIFDVYAVNNLHLGFFTGFGFYFVLVAGLIVLGLRFKENKVSKQQLSFWLAGMLILLFLPLIASGDSGALSILKLLIIGAVGFLAYLFRKGSLRIIKLGIWCYAFTILGISTYFTTLIRSNADPAIDMYNIDNPMSLVGLLNRDQYGDWPIVKGQNFLAEPTTSKEGDMQYAKANGKYVEIGKESIPEYDEKDKMLFPRTWDSQNEQGHFDFYISWLNLDVIKANEYSQVTSVGDGMVQTVNVQGKPYTYSFEDNYASVVQEGQTLQPGDRIAVKKPNYRDNMEYLFTYQMGLMYWRYFMWNFAGKQNDLQGFGNVRDGNWISGISLIDNARLGDQDKMPATSKNNKADNKLYLFPFLLGILGCVFQFLRNRKDWIVTFLLFFMTGLAIVFYLNQPGNQPRERDYAFAGSCYAFAIWIGLAVPAFVKLIRDKLDKNLFNNTLIFGAVLTFLIGVMSSCYETGSAMILSSLMMTVLYVALTAILTLAIRAISSGGQNHKLVNIATGVVCLIAPILMAQREWNDHDRSTKRLSRDSAVDYLQSCAPNAILFTFGDNDTYPLWYAQEVENVRPDIRIINNSLLGIDWYINQLRYKVNESPPIDVIWGEDKIRGDKRNFILVMPKDQKETTYSDLYTLMKDFAQSDDPSKQINHPRYGMLNYLPTRKVSIPVDLDVVRKNGTVNADDSVVSVLNLDLNRSYLPKNDIAILNIIAANKWQRPIYFTAPYGSLGFGQYLRKDGLTYRLVPVILKQPEANWLTNQQLGQNVIQMRDINVPFIKDNLMNKFIFTSGKGTYFDEENRRHALNIRGTFAEVAGDIADMGQKEDAKRLLRRCDSLINNKDLPYGMIFSGHGGYHNIYGTVFLEACYKAGDTVLAAKVKADLLNEIKQEDAYYNYMQTEKESSYKELEPDARLNRGLMMIVDSLDKKYNPKLNTIIPPGTKKDSLSQLLDTLINGKYYKPKNDSPKRK
jgi:hypothetical protein